MATYDRNPFRRPLSLRTDDGLMLPSIFADGYSVREDHETAGRQVANHFDYHRTDFASEPIKAKCRCAAEIKRLYRRRDQSLFASVNQNRLMSIQAASVSRSPFHYAPFSIRNRAVSQNSRSRKSYPAIKHLTLRILWMMLHEA